MEAIVREAIVLGAIIRGAIVLGGNCPRTGSRVGLGLGLTLTRESQQREFTGVDYIGEISLKRLKFELNRPRIIRHG